MIRSSIMQTYTDLLALRYPTEGLQICYEYVSTYRRVVVLKDDSGFILRVSYKGIAASLKIWERRFRNAEEAKGWATVQASNLDIIISHTLSVKDYAGRQKI